MIKREFSFLLWYLTSKLFSPLFFKTIKTLGTLCLSTGHNGTFTRFPMLSFSFLQPEPESSVLEGAVLTIRLMPGDFCLAALVIHRESRKRPGCMGCGWEGSMSTSRTLGLTHPPPESQLESDSYLHTLMVLYFFILFIKSEILDC